MTNKEKLINNIEALKVVFKEEPVGYSERKLLRNFSGWGSLKCLLLDPFEDSDWVTCSQEDKSLRPFVQELHEILMDKLTVSQYKSAIQSIKNSTLTSFYTPAVVPQVFYSVLKEFMEVNSIYEPSAGMGVFIDSAIDFLPLQNIVVAYEKDFLTEKILNTLLAIDISYDYSYVCHNKPFEESGKEMLADLIVSNIPFGAFPVYDPTLPKDVTNKIHNYFFAKGLEKIKEGGILAYLTTNAFLDTITNKSAREYLFKRADFISLTVMPDNLMKETGGTEAPSHFLVVRKNSNKKELSGEEQQLVNAFKSSDNVSWNQYISNNNFYICIGDRFLGKNQYGQPHIETRWNSPIKEIGNSFKHILERDFEKRFKRETPFIDSVAEAFIKQSEKDVEKLIWESDTSKLDDSVPWEEETNYRDCYENGEQIPYDLPKISDENVVKIDDICSKKEEVEVEGVSPGMLIMHDKKVVKVEKVQQNKATVVSLELSAKEIEILSSYIPIRDAFLELEKMESYADYKNK